MLRIFTDNSSRQNVSDIVESVQGLNEHVEIVNWNTLSEDHLAEQMLIVENSIVKWPIDWKNSEPPLLFPNMLCTQSNLLAMIMTKLGHLDTALQYNTQDNLNTVIYNYACLLSNNGSPKTVEKADYLNLHNSAVLLHYLDMTQNSASIASKYKLAISQSPNDELNAYTTRQYSTFLLDNSSLQESEEVLSAALELNLSDDAKFAIQFDLINVLIHGISVSDDISQINELKDLISENLEFYEKAGNRIHKASLLLHASAIANIEQNFTESLSCMNEAIHIYEAEDLQEFMASAYLNKGNLLFSWAQNGNPQFYKKAIETYQQALKYFNRSSSPGIFAEIHHDLGIIYAEMPVDQRKKSIWAALSATSFEESLNYYSKQNFPYEHARVKNNFANALMKFPESKRKDNFDSAISLYLDVLELRTANEYPLERAHTILNYLEACWRVNNVNRTMERVRYKDMLHKAIEIKNLVNDPELVEMAESHLERLKAMNHLVLETNHA